MFDRYKSVFKLGKPQVGSNLVTILIESTAIGNNFTILFAVLSVLFYKLASCKFHLQHIIIMICHLSLCNSLAGWVEVEVFSIILFLNCTNNKQWNNSLTAITYFSRRVYVNCLLTLYLAWQKIWLRPHHTL
jgi:hypothetical protein